MRRNLHIAFISIRINRDELLRRAAEKLEREDSSESCPQKAGLNFMSTFHCSALTSSQFIRSWSGGEAIKWNCINFPLSNLPLNCCKSVYWKASRTLIYLQSCGRKKEWNGNETSFCMEWNGMEFELPTIFAEFQILTRTFILN